ncbi:MAG: arginine--tRNA ligase [Deltaproteobacteria bacterium]|nr:arginine--tRNA ligase [Deltaproteobacteria bacterium]
MKERLTGYLRPAVDRLLAAAGREDEPVEISLEQPKEKKFGDYATNVAMQLARPLRRSPREIAAELQEYLRGIPDIEELTVAGPGFLNFKLSPACWQAYLAQINRLGSRYGDLDLGTGRRVMVEFVSANPTGPLHIGHGRGAAVGDSLARILRKAGYTTISEYYINDAGNQMEILGRSLQWRYLELLGREAGAYPENYYQGDYLVALAARLRREKGDDLVGEDREASLPLFTDYASRMILEEIRRDLVEFGVDFDNWTSEKQFFLDGRVDQVIAELRQQGVVYEQDGALWFAASRFGDEKDRVVVRANGVKTYFASDIAYHLDKHERGFDLLIDVWGADHHGYIPRLSAALEAMGIERERFQVVLVQLVSLLRGGQPVAMSTRAGQFVTLRQVVDEVGRDAARFFFLMRRPDSHLDFDLELAKAQSNENPVYYVQYAHARICSVFRKAGEAGMPVPQAEHVKLDRLELAEELELIKKMASFPVAIEAAARNLEPHRIAYFLLELAALFHSYYNRNRIIVGERPLSDARLLLAAALRQVFEIGLGLLGVGAPTSM